MFADRRQAIVAGVLLGVVALVVAFPALVTDWAPGDATGRRLAAPSWAHLLGTDSLERDVLARVLRGGRVSLLVGLVVAAAAGVLGVAVGLVAGARGGWLDDALMRLTDLFLAAPALVLLLLLSRLPEHHAWARSVLGPPGSVRVVVVLLSLVVWMPMARVVRSTVIGVRERAFVEAARGIGVTPWRIAVRHLLPNCRGPIVVQLTLSVAAAILAESSLSFLGFGVQAVSTPTWGNLLEGQGGALSYAPHLVWGPAGAIVVAVVAVHLLGDALRR